ncbi:MAG: hypothetical protein AAGI07_11810 [Bacteroidota bacterium]
MDTLQLSLKPNSEKWSALACIEHLNRYCAFYIPYFKKPSLKQVNDKEIYFTSDWLWKKFTNMMSPENTKKQKTLKHMNPLHSNLTKENLYTFIAWQKGLLEILNLLKKKTLIKESFL